MTERLFLRLHDDALYAPETTVPAGTLQEFDVPPALRGQVAHLMAYDETLPPDTVVTERVLPDGAVHLIVDLAGEPPSVRVAGASLRPVTLALRGRLHGLSVTLRPGAVSSLWGVGADEIAERELSWDELAPSGQRHLPEELQEAGSAAKAAARLASALQALGATHASGRHEAARRLARHAVALFDARDEIPSVAEVAGSLGVSERRLQQVFQTELGVAPRSWRRLARLHALLRRIRAVDTARWAQHALEGGFYDQPHLVREFRSLCGLTPREFLTRQVAGSSKTPSTPGA